MIRKATSWCVIDGCTLYAGLKILLLLVALIITPLCLWLLLWLPPTLTEADYRPLQLQDTPALTQIWDGMR